MSNMHQYSISEWIAENHNLSLLLWRSPVEKYC